MFRATKTWRGLMTRPIIHPGEILAEEFLKPSGVTAHQLAAELKIPYDVLREILECRRHVCVDIALRLSRYFGTSERFWLEAQLAHDLERARRHKAATIRDEVRPLGSAA
jgi:antitoxin HigA-1